MRRYETLERGASLVAALGVGLDDESLDSDRRFVFATAYDRGLVIAAARTLLTRIAPIEVPRGELTV